MRVNMSIRVDQVFADDVTIAAKKDNRSRESYIKQAIKEKIERDKDAK